MENEKQKEDLSNRSELAHVIYQELCNDHEKTRAELEPTVSRQEFLRRAIEVGSSSLQKMMVWEGTNRKVLDNLASLVLLATKKLKEEIQK